MNGSYSYDRDDFESSLRYLVSEYGIESLAGQGKIQGMGNAVLLMHDYFNTRFHTNEYNLLKTMEQTGILRRIVALKGSGKNNADCVSELNACVNTLYENFIRTDIAVKYVNIIASVVGLNSRADVPLNSSSSTKTENRAASQPLQPSQQSSNSSVISGSSSVEKISDETLENAYKSNPYKARKTYMGKTLEVRGKIDNMTSEGGTPAIIFREWGDGRQTFFISKNDPLLADIETGKYATIRGYVSEVDTSHWSRAYKLTDCTIISAN